MEHVLWIGSGNQKILSIATSLAPSALVFTLLKKVARTKIPHSYQFYLRTNIHSYPENCSRAGKFPMTSFCWLERNRRNRDVGDRAYIILYFPNLTTCIQFCGNIAYCCSAFLPAINEDNDFCLNSKFDFKILLHTVVDFEGANRKPVIQICRWLLFWWP